MSTPTRHVMIGLVLGALGASMVGIIGPGAVLGDEAAAGFDPAALVHFRDRDYTVDYDDSVSTTPISTSRIKKIEYGRVSYVDITTTSTGTYSSDALTSGHIRYPGVEVTRVPAAVTNAVSIWGDNGQWLVLPLQAASSVTYFQAGANVAISGGGYNCIITPNSRVC